MRKPHATLNRGRPTTGKPHNPIIAFEQSLRGLTDATSYNGGNSRGALKSMAKKDNRTIRSALHDRDRRGILIPVGQLEGSGLSVGDRFTLKKGQRNLFTLVLVKHDAGEIFFDRSGIFIERTRRVDILLGGIFDAYQVEIVDAVPPMLLVKTMDPGLAAIR